MSRCPRGIGADVAPPGTQRAEENQRALRHLRHTRREVCLGACPWRGRGVWPALRQTIARRLGGSLLACPGADEGQ